MISKSWLWTSSDGFRDFRKDKWVDNMERASLDSRGIVYVNLEYSPLCATIVHAVSKHPCSSALDTQYVRVFCEHFDVLRRVSQSACWMMGTSSPMPGIHQHLSAVQNPQVAQAAYPSFYPPLRTLPRRHAFVCHDVFPCLVLHAQPSVNRYIITSVLMPISGTVLVSATAKIDVEERRL